MWMYTFRNKHWIFKILVYLINMQVDDFYGCSLLILYLLKWDTPDTFFPFDLWGKTLAVSYSSTVLGLQQATVNVNDMYVCK